MFDETDMAAHIESTLATFLHEKAGSIRRQEPVFEPMVETLTNFVLGGGKRLRPVFAWWTWRGAGGDPDGAHAPGVLQAVSSLELLQACALIHDDLIDSSDSRRGAPTVHVAFREHHAAHNWLGTSESFGTAAAVLIGDLALAWADDMFHEAALPCEDRDAGWAVWKMMRTEVLTGQYLDVHTQVTGDSSPEAALRVNRLKTAPYTVQRPVHLGATLANAGNDILDPMLEFGRDLGMAFQLRDDLLGVFGDPTVTGKPAGDDLREGKRTLLVALGLQYAEQQGRKRQAATIEAGLGQPELTESDVTEVRQALVDVGAVVEVERRITRLTGDSLGSLRRAGLTREATDRLADLADLATSRTS